MIGHHGEYADYFVVPEKNVHILPHNVSWPEAALIDTLAGPVWGIEKGNIQVGSTVAVYGAGPAGLFFCKLAKLRGAQKVYLVGTRDNRLAFGEQYGADVILNTKKDKVEEFILQDTQGNGVDVVIERRRRLGSTAPEVLKKAASCFMRFRRSLPLTSAHQMNELVIGVECIALRYPLIELVAGMIVSKN